MASALDTALSIVKDPALPTLVNRLTILRDLEVADSGAPAPAGPPTPSGSTAPGIGLHRAVSALDAYIWFRRNRWIVPAVVGGLVLIPGLVGFFVGRASR